MSEIEFSDRTLVALMATLIAMVDEKTPIKRCVEIAKEILEEVEGVSGGRGD